MSKNQYKWAASGDINAFFGLMLDNLAGLVFLVTLLGNIFQFPAEFAFQYMIPGTAIGVMVGDLLFFRLAFKYAQKSGSKTVTAMPLGLDTPSTFGMCLFVIGPAFQSALEAGVLKAKGLEKLAEGQQLSELVASLPEGLFNQIEFAAATQAWHIGICGIFLSGIIKLICSFGSSSIRRLVPRAGLLGSLAAIAMVIIAFNPLVEICKVPIVGLVSLVMVLMTLIARIRLPFNTPGALGTVLVACMVYYGMRYFDTRLGTSFIPPNDPPFDLQKALMPTGWTTVFNFGWFSAETFQATAGYLPLIIPFAIGTVIGGIDCAESAASVGDDFDTRTVIGVEAIATLAASFCGGVIQTTPYIGHPAYKAMGGRAAYTLLTALLIGAAGLTGYFVFFYLYVPKVAIFSILIFIGLEISAQSFHVTPKRHYAAIAIACLPAMAQLLKIFQIQSEDSAIVNQLAGGFIMTSLIWASALAFIIDRKLLWAAGFFLAASLLSVLGVMHSPIAGDKVFWIMNLGKEDFQSVLNYSVGYLVVAGILVLFHFTMKNSLREIRSDEEFEQLSM